MNFEEKRASIVGERAHFAELRQRSLEAASQADLALVRCDARIALLDEILKDQAAAAVDQQRIEANTAPLHDLEGEETGYRRG